MQPSWPDVAEPGTFGAPLGVPGLDDETLVTTTAYDALNRVVRVQIPSGKLGMPDHVALPAYNETGLLGGMSVQIYGAAATPLVQTIAYNEKEQRLQIVYGNGITTAYTYEHETFRLSTLQTTRGTEPLQDLSYTYDPVGNITTIEDGAQQTLYVGNSKVAPRMTYTYDAIYRLVYALGREHTGQAVPDQTRTPDGVPIPSPTDPQAMRNYAETYQYDPVGNFAAMVHAAADASGNFQNLWTRTYTTDTPATSGTPGTASNRLLQTVIGGGVTTPPTTYGYDDAGNMKSMSGVLGLDWNWRNELIHANPGSGYVYFTNDAAGQRVRKVKVAANGALTERIYLGAYEIYRERPTSSSPPSLERRTLDVTDGQRRIALVELLTVGTPATTTSINDGPAQLIRYQLDNHLGSAVLELDGNATLLSYEEYHPYGTTAYRATNSAITTSPKRYAFIGKERDRRRA